MDKHTTDATPPPLRRCRTCDVAQPWDAEHFRPLAMRSSHQLLLMQRCRACEAAAGRGELPTGHARERARRQALAAAVSMERPTSEDLLRTRRAEKQARDAIARCRRTAKARAARADAR